MTRSPVLVTLVLVAGCSDINPPPDHTPAYPFDISGDVFHWPVNRLPVRYFADTRGATRAYVERAIGLWESQFLYGEFRGELADDSTAADVIVVWETTVPPDVPPDPGPPVKACGGRTELTFDGSGTALAGPLHTYLDILAGSYTPAQLAACMQRTVVHELGHTMGLPHAPDSVVAIMNVTPLLPAPNDNDRRTVEYLYHVTPTIAPPPR